MSAQEQPTSQQQRTIAAVLHYLLKRAGTDGLEVVGKPSANSICVQHEGEYYLVTVQEIR